MTQLHLPSAQPKAFLTPDMQAPRRGTAMLDSLPAIMACCNKWRSWDVRAMDRNVAGEIAKSFDRDCVLARFEDKIRAPAHW
jgi:hypothetical protein